MAAELRDYRGRISVLADCVIDAEAKATGRERQEIVREVAAEGLSGLVSGVSGQSGNR